jgi:hypothetical protein
MIELQTSVKQEDTTRTRTPKPGYLNVSITQHTPYQGFSVTGYIRTGTDIEVDRGRL